MFEPSISAPAMIQMIAYPLPGDPLMYTNQLRYIAFTA
jgi:hypothetical protein